MLLARLLICRQLAYKFVDILNPPCRLLGVLRLKAFYVPGLLNDLPQQVRRAHILRIRLEMLDESRKRF